MLDTDCKSGYIEHQNGYSKSEKNSCHLEFRR